MKVRTSLATLCFFVFSITTFGQTPATFTTQTYPPGTSARTLYAVDLNNDGVLDLVHDVNSGVTSFTVEIANGDGSFRTPVTYSFPEPMPQGTPAMASGDFNNDGNADLVFAGAGDQRIFVYLGKGDGTFQAPKVITTALPIDQHFGGTPVVAADFNRDGKLDIATEANTTNHGTLYVFPGDGAGGFGAPRIILQAPTDRGIGEDLSVGDFDADGKADLAYQETGACDPGPCDSRIHVAYGDGSFGFTDTVPFAAPTYYAIRSGDLNQDGRSDLFGFVGGATNNLVILYGQTNRSFIVKTATVAHADITFGAELQMADFNGDNNLDLVGATFNSMVFLLQNGTGGFSEQDYPLASASFQIHTAPVVGDFNQDLKPDAAMIATRSDSSNILYELVNTTNDGSFSAHCSYPKSGQGIHLCVTPGAPQNLGGFVASANSFGHLRKMELWVDGKKIAEQFHAWGDRRAWFDLGVSSNFPGTAGTHKATMFAVDVDNRLQRLDWTFTSPSSSGCVTPSTSIAISICAPTSGSTVTSPVHVSAAGGSAVTFMEVWVDGTKHYQTSGNHVETDLTLGSGSHTMTIYGRNSSGVVGKATETFTVGSGGGTCSQPASATATVICSPANGSTVSSPVSVQARGGSSVNFMEVWVDGTKRFQTSGNTVSTSLSLAAGSHKLTVFSRNGTTVLSSAVSTFTVH